MNSVLSIFIVLFSAQAFSSEPADVWNSINEIQGRMTADQARLEKLLMSGFKDKTNGLRWSVNLPSIYSNGCKGFKVGHFDCTALNSDTTSTKYVVDEDSAAQAACRKLGGRLPTIEEFQSLMKSFEKTIYVSDSSGGGDYVTKWTNESNNEFYAIFGLNDNDVNFWNSTDLYWTSTVFVDVSTEGGFGLRAMTFSRAYQGGLKDHRTNHHKVRCVFETKK